MQKGIRIGILGTDTSHSVRFTEILNDADFPYHVAGGKVTAAFPGGSPDIEASRSRMDGFRQELKEKWKVKIVDSIAELVKEVDAVLLESVDGRQHLSQFMECMKAKIPVFIDKPLAVSLKDANKIIEISKKEGVPVFSSSSLRFDVNITEALREVQEGDILGCDACSQATLEPTNPGLYWYGVHGCEILYTVMGRGCEKVWCIGNENYDFVTGLWKGGRIGTMRGLRKGGLYGCTIYRESGAKRVHASSTVPFYTCLLREIMNFFKTGIPPVSQEETLEIMSFIDAANRSKESGGKEETLEVKIP